MSLSIRQNISQRISSSHLAWLFLYTMILLAWLAVYLMQQDAGLGALRNQPIDFWASLCLSAGQANYSALVFMWAIMSMAMMLPTLVPAFNCYINLPGRASPNAISIAGFVVGYLMVWLGASLLAAFLQQALMRDLWLAPTGESLSPYLSALLLLIAGAYQFTSFKENCLTKCRMPLTFFLERWQAGPKRAMMMGLELGVICFGCCWALMLLAFIGGTMNLLWMGAATLFMTFEKLSEPGRYLTKPAGVICCLAGFYQLFVTVI